MSSTSSVRALVASLKAAPAAESGPTLAELVAACSPAELVDLALSEGLAGLVGEKLGGLLPPEERSRLVREARLDAVRHMAYLALLAKFASALDEADVTWVVLKGPALAELSYRDTPRGYADLDLMVPAGQLGRAVGALEGVGAVLAEPNWPRLVKDAKGQLTMAIHGSPVVDLHWHLVYLRRAREAWKIPTDDLLARRRAVRLRDVDAWVLDPEDFTAHVALHAGFGAVQQLRRLVDIERTVTHQAPDWDMLVRRCRAWRIGLAVAVMLNRARQTLGAPVPTEVVQELVEGRLSLLLARGLDAWVPSGRLPGHRSIRNGLTRSLRHGPLTTGRAFAEESLRAVAGLIQARTAGSADPGVVIGDPGHSPGFEHYLEMVGHADRYGHLGSARQWTRAAARQPKPARIRPQGL